VKPVDYDDQIYKHYSRGREMSDATMQVWLDVFEQYLPPKRPLAIADVGSGTGRFSQPLAMRFGGPVWGIEPSKKMRQVAVEANFNAEVTFLEGSAEIIPLDAGSCDAALLSYVWHHVVDKRSAAVELARIIRAEGVLLMRTNFSDRPTPLWWYPLFPELAQADAAMYADTATELRDLEETGWRRKAIREVEVQTAASHRESFDRLATRSLSAFSFLPAPAIDRGLASIERALPSPSNESPVFVKNQLVVMERKPPDGSGEDSPALPH